jgi:hypothetical protein
LIAAVAGIGILAAVFHRGEGIRTRGEPDGGESRPGPEVILRNVVLREVRKDGAQYRLLSAEATYRILDGRVRATDVTLELPGGSAEGAGEGIITAPKADWNMQTGRIVLPDGGVAESNAGWSAAVAAANLYLPERILASSGKAAFSGPGLTVAGDNLVWYWKEGKVSLQRPKTRIDPDRVPGRGR